MLDTLGISRHEGARPCSLGEFHIRLEDPGQANEGFEQALAHSRRIGDLSNQARAGADLGEIAQITGDPTASLNFYAEALALATKAGARY